MPQESGAKAAAAMSIEQALDEAAAIGAEDLATRAQAFFADYAEQIRKPHFGPLHREVISAMLVRAEEAGLFKPSKEG